MSGSNARLLLKRISIAMMVDEQTSSNSLSRFIPLLNGLLLGHAVCFIAMTALGPSAALPR